MTPVLEWQFGGGLRHLPPPVAWALLALALVAGAGLVVWLYRRTLTELSAKARWMLTMLRVILVLLLLFCLANPMRVSRAMPEKHSRTLAVLVDRSASMTQPDHRSQTRLADALRTWKPHEAEAKEAFSEITYARFAKANSEAKTLDDAVTAAESGSSETRLYAALLELLKENPAAVVCLTDGLNTTKDAAEAVTAEALKRGVPLYFVAGKNRARGGENILARETKVPSRVLRRSEFNAEVLIEAAVQRDGELPVELWRGDAKIAEAKLPLRMGLNTVPWSVKVKAGEAGVLPLEFRVGDGVKQVVTARSTRVVANTTVDMLYYQGALQWGFRFLRGALENDPSFRLTAILNPALGIQMAVQAPGPVTLPDLPEDAAALKRFQVVVLAHVFADQLSVKQQQALVDYVRGGGGVLFISPDTESTRQFSGTALEQMLPVVFKSPRDESQAGVAEAQFQQAMHTVGGSDAGAETVFAGQAMRRQAIPPLVPFAPGNAGAGTKLFQPGDNAPEFVTYAQIQTVKPGADILAVHPTEIVPGQNTPQVLVARQRFGDGFAAALNTDLLWRWKLSLPSTNRAVEIFWQQFMLSLVSASSAPGLQLKAQTESPQVNRLVKFEVDGVAGDVPKVSVKSPDGNVQPLAVAQFNGPNGLVWLASFVPTMPGRWLAEATDAGGASARATVAVANNAQTLETMRLPTDVDGLRRLAESTGGALIEEAPVFHAAAKPDADAAKVVRMQAVWDSRWLATLLLGVYAVELVMRRIYKLL